MCKMENKVEVKTAFSKYEHREYGSVVAIDVTTKFLKEYLTAKMYLDSMPMSTDCQEDLDHAKKIMEEKVRPFFQHMDEILDTL